MIVGWLVVARHRFGIRERLRRAGAGATADSISFYFRLDFSREFRKNWNMSRPLGLPKTGGRVRGIKTTVGICLCS
jgi:hypothetical protein